MVNAQRLHVQQPRRSVIAPGETTLQANLMAGAGG